MWISELQDQYDRARGTVHESEQIERIGAAWDANERARCRYPARLTGLELEIFTRRPRWTSDLVALLAAGAALSGWFVVLSLLG